jgi:hypothetical protein
MSHTSYTLSPECAKGFSEDERPSGLFHKYAHVRGNGFGPEARLSDEHISEMEFWMRSAHCGSAAQRLQQNVSSSSRM